MKDFRAKTAALFSLIALICVLYFMFAAILFHFIRSDLDPIATVLSVYALGESGIWLRAGFLLIGLSEIILSIQISKTTGDAKRFGRFLLFIAGIGVCIVAIDEWGKIHNTGALLQFTFFPIAVLLIGTRQQKRVERTISISIAAVTLILIVLLLLIGFGDPFHMVDISGLVQKINICVIWIWLCFFSYKVFRVTW